MNSDSRNRIYQNLELKIKELENKEDYEKVIKTCLDLEEDNFNILEAFKVDRKLLINETSFFKDIILANTSAYAISKNKNIQSQNKKSIEDLKETISNETIDLEGFNDIIVTEILKDNNSSQK